MSLSIFSTVTDPDERGDEFMPAIKCYLELADELVMVDGSRDALEFVEEPIEGSASVTQIKYRWPREFSWDFIGKQFQRGYEACTGDWVMHCDIDWLFHERDYGRIHQALRDYPDAPAISFYKHQFLVPDLYNLKSRLVICVNKKKFGDRIKFDAGGDLCQPSLDGQELKLEEMPQAGIPFWCYEKLSKTQEQVIDDVTRMDRAWQRHFGEWLYSNDGTAESAYQGWLKMMLGRLEKPHAAVRLQDHPRYMQDVLKHLHSDQWGFDGFGNLERNSYAQNRSNR